LMKKANNENNEIQKGSPQISPKKKRSSEGASTPPRKAQNDTNGDQIDVSSDNRGERDGVQIFLRVIMCGFTASSKGPRGPTKRNMAELRAIHVAPPKVAKKRPLLGFTNSEKVNIVPNEELPLVIIVGIPGHDVARCLLAKEPPSTFCTKMLSKN